MTNQTGGTITGVGGDVSISGAAGMVTNAGYISGTKGIADGVFLQARRDRHQPAGAGPSPAVWSASGSEVPAGAVVNYGSIAGDSGVYLAAGGTITNKTGGTITGSTGVAVKGATGAVTNAGFITVTGDYAVGVYLGAVGTVTNQTGGTISGSLWRRRRRRRGRGDKRR